MPLALASQHAKASLQTLQTVLLAVTGMSPAVLTETVWALAQESPPIIPDRVVVVTTTDGRDAIKEELFTPPDNSVWDQLRQRLSLMGRDVKGRLQFGPTGDHIRVFTMTDKITGRAREMNDITTVEENSAAADFLMNAVWEQVTALKEARLVASIAGGRKTMSALLFACVSLLGRPTDLLTHVLVNEPFEKPSLRPRFYFPLKEPVTHRAVDRDGKVIEARTGQAAVRLAKIEFVPLRTLFEREFVRKRSYSELVAVCQGKADYLARENVRLTVWRNRPEIQVNNTTVRLSSKQHLFVTLLAERAAAGEPPFCKYHEAAGSLRQKGEELFGRRNPKDFSDWRQDARLPQDREGDEQLFRKLRSEIIAKLRKAGDDAHALIALLPEARRCSLDLPKRSIVFEG
jgi:CRISPR-associated protein (TIGR02584 family)